MDPVPPPLRKIIHIDMDAFYASVEQRDNPALRGQPITVGGGGPRGVVATASYEARTFGVKSAMPGARARRLCPGLIFVTPRFDAYRAASTHIRDIFSRYTDIVQPLSLDEAYLDVTVNKPGIASATQVAEEIRHLIRAETGLTASAGVSYNKLIAKLASDQNKPDGVCVVRGGCMNWGSRRGRTCARATCAFSRPISAVRRTIIIARRGARMTGPCASVKGVNPSAWRTHFPTT